MLFYKGKKAHTHLNSVLHYTFAPTRPSGCGRVFILPKGKKALKTTNFSAKLTTKQPTVIYYISVNQRVRTVLYKTNG